MPSVTRFLLEFRRPSPGAVLVEETTYERGGRALPATLYRPRGRSGPLPGWVTLHGLTWHGREHDSLRRFARALAASGAAVLVPDLPEWRELRVAPEATAETIRAAVLTLDASELTEPGRIGVMGFSFGATQGLVAAADPSLEGHLAGVAAWGGYGDIARVTRFAFLGEHELDGRGYRLPPDPYGRWILAGNFITLVPGHEGDDALADALLGLAIEAGRRKIMSWDPAMDGAKVEARARLDARQADVFDLVAPPANAAPTPAWREAAGELATRLGRAAVRHYPLLDPAPFLPRVTVPVFLAHGRGDRLMPWTEMVRLRRLLPPDVVTWSGVTSLFAHSVGERRWPTPALAVEAVRFVRLMRRMVGLI